MRGSYTRNHNHRDYMTVKSILSETKEDYYALFPSLSINMPWKKHAFALKSVYYYDNSEITYLENANSDGSTLKFGQLIIDLVDNIRFSKKFQLSIDLQQRFVNVDNSIMSYNKSYFTPKAYITIEMPKSSQLSLGAFMGVFNPDFNLYDTTVKSIDPYQTLTDNPDLPIRDVWSAYYSFYMQRNWGYLQLYGSESKYISLGKTVTMPALLRFSAGYNYKGLNLNFSTRNPFMRCHTKRVYSVDDFNQTSRSYTPYESYEFFNISVSYRFNYGKKHKFNDVDVDTQKKSAIL